MPNANPNQGWIDARTNLKDTAKWIVTILGATIVLVIGGGLIAKIADLDLIQRLAAAGCLLVLMSLCLIPLQAAVEIIATKLESFENIATLNEYKPTREVVNRWLAQVDSGELATVEGRYRELVENTRIANKPANSDAEKAEQNKANKALDALQQRITDALDLSNTEYLRLKFERLVCITKCVLPAIALLLALFFVFVHTDDRTEKQLAKPILLQIPWGAGVEAAMKKAGLDEKCYAPTRPQLLQLSEKSGLRAGVLVVPRDLGAGCPALRVIVTNTDEVYPDN
jgi:hypothetical protein